jgi:hypothetical protein
LHNGAAERKEEVWRRTGYIIIKEEKREEEKRKEKIK